MLKLRSPFPSTVANLQMRANTYVENSLMFNLMFVLNLKKF